MRKKKKKMQELHVCITSVRMLEKSKSPLGHYLLLTDFKIVSARRVNALPPTGILQYSKERANCLLIGAHLPKCHIYHKKIHYPSSTDEKNRLSV